MINDKGKQVPKITLHSLRHTGFLFSVKFCCANRDHLRLNLKNC